jgi:hypothetical protein
MRKNRTIRMSKETSQMMKEQLEAFKEKFGREAGPDDPVFFNPDCETPTPLTEEDMDRMMAEALEKSGINLEIPPGESVFDAVISKFREGKTQSQIEAEVRRMRRTDRNREKRIRKGGTK